MIFLFDKFKKLKGTVRNRHTISLLYERERNGLYTVAAEIPLKITDKKTVYNYHKKVKDSEFLGHYDREGRFQLHKIASVDIEDSSIFIKGVHLFFDEAKAGAIIQERRFRNSEIADGARVAFDTIGWTVVDVDVSDRTDYIFYNVSPLEARAILVETFGYEFDYWLDFDGKNIRNKQISIKREMGIDSNKRYNYGHNVLNIKVEQDYSEIYTAVIGRGKGEDLGDDAYGRRIEYTDVEWKTPTNPMNKPKGSRTLHDENATQLFGYHEDGKVSPRTKVEIFEDIEEPEELLQATYEWLKENSVPKAVFSLKVPDGDGLDLGDKVHVIYRDIDLVKHTRVTRVVDDLVSGNRDVEFGDTAYFKTDRRLSGVKSELKRVGGSISNRISRLKAEFDQRFDDEVQQWKDDFEQAVIDAEAAVAVMRAEMEEEIDKVTTAFNERFEAEKDAAYEEAQRNYDAISDRINDVVDTTRTEMNTAFEESVRESKEFAQAEADAKSKEVQDNLDSFKGEHEQIVGELQGNIIDIDGEIADARADVSEIVGRLTVVDGSITGITDSLTEIEGTLTNTKTQLENQISDARTELEQSISNTRIELENKIDETENALNQVGEDLGNAKTDLQNQLDEARAELEGLEVGGRNYLTVPKDIVSDNAYRSLRIVDGVMYWTQKSSATAGFAINSYAPDTIGTYTFSFKTDNDENIRRYLNTPKSGTRNSTLNISEQGENFLVSLTYRNFNPNERISFYGGEPFEPIQEVKFWDFKLEKGTVATDWSPAPEDTDNKITNINQIITNIEGELSSKVEKTEVDALRGTVTAQGTLLTQTADEVSSKAEKSVVDTLTGRVSNAESSVTQNAEEIAKKLTKSVYDEDKKDTDAKITQWSNTASETAEGLTRVIGRVSETEKGVDTAQTRIEAEAGRIDGVLSRTSNVEGQVRDAQLAIEANADGLALRATKTEVEQAIDGIEVGGRNFILDSSNIQRRSVASGITSEKVTDMGYTNVLKINNPNLNSYFTINRDSYAEYPTANKDFTLSFLVRGIANDSSNKTLTTYYNASTGYTRMKGDIKEDEYSWVSVTFNTHDNVPNNHIGVSAFKELYFAKMKVEMGNIRTDWTPAPEDIDASISEVTDRVTTAEAELVVQAGEISQRATQSELDRVTGRVSTAETSIIQNADEIARRLVKSDYDSDKQATDAEITKWSNLATETAEGLEQTISRVSTEEGKMSKAQADIKANADEIATKVSSSQFNSLSGKVSDNTSAITQTANEVKSKVTQAEVDYSMTHIDNGSIKTVKDVASYYNSLSTVTGALLIKTNLTGRAMSRVFIKGYNYSTNDSNIDVVISFYNFSTSILNHSYTSTGSKSIDRVRLFRDSDGIVYILLNDFDSTWKYPAIMVDRFDMSYVTNWSWGEDWEMSVVDSMPEDVAYITEVKGQDYGSIVSKHETDIVQNAKEIALKATQSDLDSVTGRVSTAESQLSVQAGQIALRATKKELDGVAGRVSATESSLTVLDDEISSVVGRVSGNETNISSIVQDVGSITSTVATMEGDLATQGSQISQANQAISSKVWQSDIHNPNIMPFHDITVSESRDKWNGRPTSVVKGTFEDFMIVRDSSVGATIGIMSPLLADFIRDGETFTLSWEGDFTPGNPISRNFSYMFMLRPTLGNVQIPTPTKVSIGNDRFRYSTTFTINGIDPFMRILISTHSETQGENVWFRIRNIKLEYGSRATPYRSSFSGIEQRVDSISHSVQEIDDAGYISQSDVVVRPDYVQLGSQRLGDNQLASILRVSPNSIDAITDNLNLTGNLNVKGQIESLSVSAVRGDIAYLKSNILTANSINASHIESNSITSKEILVNSALVNSIISTNVFADDVTSRIGNFIDINAGNIVTAGLSANVIKSDHIEASTSLVNKLFVNNARINELITKTHFVNEMRALTMDVVDLNAAQIRTKILSTNTIEATWLKSGTALLDRVFSSTAMFERMMAKTGFVSAFGAVTISADQISSGILTTPNDSFYLNLSSGQMYFRNGANIRFYNEGAALQHSKINYTAGVAFESHPRSPSAPAIWLGGTSSSSVVATHSTFTGIWAMPQNNEVDISGRHIRIRSDSGYASSSSRIINIDLSQSSFGEIYPSATYLNNFNLGRPQSKWWTTYTEYLNGLRLVDSDTKQSILFQSNGIEISSDGTIVFISKGVRTSLGYILNRI